MPCVLNLFVVKLTTSVEGAAVVYVEGLVIAVADCTLTPASTHAKVMAVVTAPV